MSGESCATCRYHYGPPGTTTGRRECRAQPPSMAIEVPQAGMPHPVFLGKWPHTLPTDWCGAFTPIPQSTPDPASERALAPGPPPGPAKPKAGNKAGTGPGPINKEA
jgi:hypothetical protein